MRFLRCKYITFSKGGLLIGLDLKQKNKVKKIINSFLVNSSEKENKSYFLYRGVDKKYLTERFSTDYKYFEESIIISKLFYFGDKSKNFLIERNSENNKKNKVLKTVDDCDENTGKYIFDKYKKLRKSKNPRIINYIESVNQISYFYDQNNRQTFARKVKICGQLVRDYYLKTLHTAGKIGISDKSFHISSSKQYSVARRFCEKKDESYIIISIHRGEEKAIENKETNKLLLKHCLPIFEREKSIYPEQYEISTRSSIYPHDIFGVYNTRKRIFIINPHLFDNVNENINLMKSPLIIDQTGFSDKLKNETNYKGWNMTYDYLLYIEGDIFG